MQCDGTSYGCNGGNTETAYAYVEKAEGLLTLREYPYTSYYGDTGDCARSAISSTETRVDISGFSSLRMPTSTATEDAMVDYVLSTGPVSVCLDASEWYSYTSGILASCGDSVDHCVQIVGVDTEGGYWKVRNSWGTEWGIDGFIYIALGSNTCYITYDPTYTTTSLSTTSATKKNDPYKITTI
jgi:C1A family cysteine protease